MPRDVLWRGLCIVGDNFHHICVDQNMAGGHHLVIHASADHLVAHSSVHMVCKVHHGGALHSAQGSFSAIRLRLRQVQHLPAHSSVIAAGRPYDVGGLQGKLGGPPLEGVLGHRRLLHVELDRSLRGDL